MSSEFEFQQSATTPAGDASALPVPSDPARAENPAWSGWDIIYIILVTLTMLFLSLWLVAYSVRRIAYPQFPVLTVMAFPMVAFSSQMLAYIVVLTFMYTTATSKSHQDFGTAVRWNWPQQWHRSLLIGFAFCIGLQLLAQVLPMPKKIAMQTFFQTPLRAWTIAIFGMSFIPLMEELFFRGFLYPVVARRLGVIAGVVFTSLSFTAIHVPQLEDPHMSFASSWGAVVLILIIGTALTIIRARQKSVASSVLMHMGYNGLTSILAIIHTGGFRHLERLSQ